MPSKVYIRPQRGGSFSSVLSKIASGAQTVLGGLKRAHDVIKKERLVSRGARALGYSDFSKKAHQAGYGRRRRRRRARRA